MIFICPYCQREQDRSPLGFKENPFCNKCLHERIDAATPKNTKIEIVDLGNGYVMIKRVLVN